MKSRIVLVLLLGVLALASPSAALNSGVQRTLVEIFNDIWVPTTHQIDVTAVLNALNADVTDRTTREVGIVSGAISFTGTQPVDVSDRAGRALGYVLAAISNVPAVTFSGTQPVALTNGAEIVVTALAPVSFLGTQPVSLTNGAAVGITSLPGVYFSSTQGVDVSDRPSRALGSVLAAISNVPAVTLSGTQPVAISNGAEIVVTAIAPIAFTGTQPVSLTNGGAVGITSLPAVYFSTTQPVDVSDRAGRVLGTVLAAISNVPAVTVNGTPEVTISYASNSFKRATATNTDSGASLVFAGEARAWTIYNAGPNTAYVSFDAVATTADLMIPAGGVWSGNKRVTTIHAITSGADTAVIQVYGEY